MRVCALLHAFASVFLRASLMRVFVGQYEEISSFSRGLSELQHFLSCCCCSLCLSGVSASCTLLPQDYCLPSLIHRFVNVLSFVLYSFHLWSCYIKFSSFIFCCSVFVFLLLPLWLPLRLPRLGHASRFSFHIFSTSSCSSFLDIFFSFAFIALVGGYSATIIVAATAIRSLHYISMPLSLG